MRVPPSGSRPVQHTNSTLLDKSSAVTRSFESQLSSAKPVSAAKPASAADIIGDVKLLAAEVKAGAITKEEASKRFVSIVIEKRHDLSSLGQKGKQIEDAVKEIAGDDPHFISRLQAQLQKLS
jgi:hypothetical protein